jgi:GNAT superfamily N-acetyltransferase
MGIFRPEPPHRTADERSVDIRRATQADATAATELWLRSRRGAHRLIPPAIHSDAEVREWMADHVIAQLECWVAEDAGQRIVGVLALEADWVDQLYVIPDRQGSGIGGGLLDQAKLRQPSGLQLWTFASNSVARRFYERRGFVAVAATDGHDNEERVPDLRYVWRAPRD